MNYNLCIMNISIKKNKVDCLSKLYCSSQVYTFSFVYEIITSNGRMNSSILCSMEIRTLFDELKHARRQEISQCVMLFFIFIYFIQVLNEAKNTSLWCVTLFDKYKR
jgi:hypothetical protein